MGFGMAVLAGLRVLAMIIAAAGIALGAWALSTIHNVEIRGTTVLNALFLEAGKNELWLRFFEAATSSKMMIWVAIGAAGFSVLATLLIILSMKLDRLRPSNSILVILEFLSMFAMAAAFGASLSFTIKLDSTCIRLDASPSPDLKAFGMLCPLSKGYSTGNSVGGFLLTVTSLVALISVRARSRAPDSCFFEPTAHGLGMVHGYQAVVPATMRTTIPSIYDPLKPIPGTPKRPLREDEIGLAEQGARMGVRESIDGVRSEEAAISEPLGLQRPEAVQSLRAKSPWE